MADIKPVIHGSDEHLTLLGAPWHLNLLTGVDRADMLAFGRACMAAERTQAADVAALVQQLRDALAEANAPQRWPFAVKQDSSRAIAAADAFLSTVTTSTTGA